MFDFAVRKVLGYIPNALLTIYLVRQVSIPAGMKNLISNSMSCWSYSLLSNIEIGSNFVKNLAVVKLVIPKIMIGSDRI